MELAQAVLMASLVDHTWNGHLVGIGVSNIGMVEWESGRSKIVRMVVGELVFGT